MNKVITIGRLTNDPDIRISTATDGNKTIAKFGYACARKGSEESDFFNVTAFGKTAEWVEKYLGKGSKIALIGRLQSSNYEKNGEKRYAVEIIAEEIEFAESKTDADARKANQASASYQQGNVQLTPEQYQAAMTMMGFPQGMPQQQGMQSAQQMQPMQQSMPQQQPQNVPQSMPQQQGMQTVQQMQAMPQQQSQNIPQSMPQQQTAPPFGQGWA